jgi:3'-5' exoribonuclease
MPRKLLKDCAAGEAVEDVFVLTQKQLSTTQTGKPFIKCFVGDRSRQVPARMWNATQGAFNAMPDGGFLRIGGRLESYQDNLQFIIDRFWIIDDPAEVKLDELLPHTAKPIPAMFDELVSLVRSVKNPSVLALMEAYLADEALIERFKRAPAAMTFHHAFVGGLLEHTLNMLKVADAVCPLYPGISRDLLIAGIFLHDIAKTWELTYDAGFGYSDGGQLVGHIVKSAIWLEDKARAAQAATGQPVPAKIIDALQHIILSHHGQPEFGAAKVPATPEAILVHYIDNIDAKMTMSLLVTRDPSVADEASFTDYQKALGVKLYRPDVTR